jgi:hypothetical protein
MVYRNPTPIVKTPDRKIKVESGELLAEKPAQFLKHGEIGIRVSL